MEKRTRKDRMLTLEHEITRLMTENLRLRQERERWRQYGAGQAAARPHPRMRSGYGLDYLRAASAASQPERDAIQKLAEEIGRRRSTGL